MAVETKLRILRRQAALATCLISATGCFIFNHSKPDRPGVFDVPQGEIGLAVTNHNYLDVAVYVLHDGQETRVGTVTGSLSILLFLPTRLLGMGKEIRLVGRAIGSPDTAMTQLLIVQPGQTIEWTLETDLRRSSVGVF